jgi:hypothetical protein
VTLTVLILRANNLALGTNEILQLKVSAETNGSVHTLWIVTSADKSWHEITGKRFKNAIILVPFNFFH